MTPVDILTWTGESPESLNPIQNTTGNDEMLKVGEFFSTEQNISIGYQVPNNQL